jgi:hypothetical protein
LPGVALIGGLLIVIAVIVSELKFKRSGAAAGTRQVADECEGETSHR